MLSEFCAACFRNAGGSCFSLLGSGDVRVRFDEEADMRAGPMTAGMVCANCERWVRSR